MRHNGGMDRFEYREVRPRRELAPFVSAIWRIDAQESRRDPPALEPILPDGCVEWILHFAEPFMIRREDGALARQAANLIAGPSTRATYLARGTESRVIGVRFHPGAARALGLPSLESLVDRVVETEDLAATRLVRAHAAIERVAEPTRIEALERLLLDAFDSRKHRQGALLADRLNAPLRPSELARDLGVSIRTLERRFATDVGFPPATLRAIVRFRRALELIDARPESRLVDIALEAGYSDEPHLCREFRRFADTTAASYRRRRSELTHAFAHGGPDGVEPI